MALTVVAPGEPGPVRIEACLGCGACILTCPERALRPARNNPAVAADRCTGCGECIEICPADAISFAGPLSATATPDNWGA